MAGHKKRQHYIPKFLLNQFAVDERIYIFDKNERSIRDAGTKDAGVIKNYYTIDIDGLAKDYLEDAFSKIETPASHIIKQIDSSHEMPTREEDLSCLFQFIALLATRVPIIRENAERGLQDIVRTSGSHILSAKYEEIRKRVLEKHPDAPDLTREELITLFNDESQIGIEIKNEMSMFLLLQMTEGILRSLYHRKWGIGYITENKSNHYVTCDNPVQLSWTNKKGGLYPPGFLLGDTVVYFAISPTTMIYSLMDDISEKPVSFSNSAIRECNTQAMAYSKRYAFGPNPSFNLFYDSEKITVQELFKKEKI